MIKVSKKNEARLIIESDDSGILRELYEYYTFFADGYKFMPAYRNKIWDGKIRMFDLRTQQLPYGLLNQTYQFSKERGYAISLDKGVTNPWVEKDDISNYISDLPLSVNGNIISLRDYQLDATIYALKNRRTILLSPTGSGKSLIIYLCIRYFLDHSNKGLIPLIVVPTTSLVAQMAKDFENYSKMDQYFDAEKEVHQIYSGKEKFNFDASVVITTWQSAIKLPAKWFFQYGMVIGDEAHTFKAKSLTTIMNRLVNANYRIGTTGTLDNAMVNQLVLEGNFGPQYKVTSTKQLMDADTLADLNINALVLKYPEESRKLAKHFKYPDEIDYIVSYQKRNNFIVNLTCDQKGNSLVLYNLVGKHGKPLYEMFQNKVEKNRKVFFVSGAVSAEERERIREITEKEKNAIIVASVGTFSTGINIVNINNIVFASPTKSQIRVLQSIGRGLRKTEDGTPTKVFDIADDLSWKKKKNYTLNHAIERIKIYAREKFKTKTYEVPL
jgi:superfamily II DNA or RNA helicase